MANAAGFPPPPPSVEGTQALDPAAVAAWEQELDRTLAQMAETIGAAIAEHEAGRLGLNDFQQLCLSAGVVRTGDILLLWDWVNGKVFAYDGFQMVELTDLPQ
ncbi:MAG: hypothetical protein GY778_09630 [bacterium]|nr:hypothetical protein [bacterium]